MLLLLPLLPHHSEKIDYLSFTQTDTSDFSSHIVTGVISWTAAALLRSTLSIHGLGLSRLSDHGIQTGQFSFPGLSIQSQDCWRISLIQAVRPVRPWTRTIQLACPWWTGEFLGMSIHPGLLLYELSPVPR